MPDLILEFSYLASWSSKSSSRSSSLPLFILSDELALLLESIWLSDLYVASKSSLYCSLSTSLNVVFFTRGLAGWASFSFSGSSAGASFYGTWFTVCTICTFCDCKLSTFWPTSVITFIKLLIESSCYVVDSCMNLKSTRFLNCGNKSGRILFIKISN